MQIGSVDELVGVTIERPVLEEFKVEIGRTLEDRVQPGLTGDDGKECHLYAINQPAAFYAKIILPQANSRYQRMYMTDARKHFCQKRRQDEC
jgi:hypothetical protein